ncbi:MAG: DGQHR domain-containing protein [Myxococcaceae bacterium]
MLTIPALKLQQFTQEFFLLNLAAGDVERLVRFEVLGEAGVQGKRPKKAAASRVNWGELEKRVGTSDKAFQRPIIRKKIDELAQYYTTCREQQLLPAIPGAVILTTESPVEFSPQGGNPFLGLVQLPEEEGTLRALDGQHRLLALAALLHDLEVSETDRAAARRLQVPAILFAALPADHVVELFVTINAKHTRLNQSLLVSLSGRQLYGDADLATVHDVIKKLNGDRSSVLKGEIKLLGVGAGRVQQAGLAQEMKQVFAELARKDAATFERFKAEAAPFFLAYFKEVAGVFEEAWGGKKYSIKSASALRAFIQVSPEVLARAMATGPASREEALRAVLAPWRERVGSARFETAGAWRAKVGGGGKETTRLLARELGAALGGLP